jgi:hypothetical protein
MVALEEENNNPFRRTVQSGGNNDRFKMEVFMFHFWTFFKTKEINELESFFTRLLFLSSKVTNVSFKRE